MRAGTCERRGASLWANRATHKAKDALRVLPGTEGSCLAERRMSASLVKGTAKIALSMLTCPGSIGSVSRRMCRSGKIELCMRSKFLHALRTSLRADLCRVMLTWLWRVHAACRLWKAGDSGTSEKKSGFDPQNATKNEPQPRQTSNLANKNPACSATHGHTECSQGHACGRDSCLPAQ